MAQRSEQFNIDEVQWHNDLALLRSMDGQIPWSERFGNGQMKVLQYDPKTQAGTYLVQWPAGYDPLEEHAHGGNSTELVLQGTLLDGDREWGPGSFFSTPAGQVHGPLKAGSEGCVFLVHTDGPLLDESFTQTLLSHGKASRRRV